MRYQKAYIYILALLAMIFWGLSFVWSTIVFEYYRPITTVFLRLVLSSVILLAMAHIFTPGEKIHREHYRLFALSALLNPFLYFLGENYGLLMTSPTVSAVIIATIPLLTPVMGVLLLKEKLTWMNYLGMIISFVGILIMLFRSDFSLAAPVVGVAFLVMAVLVAVVYSVLLKRLAGLYSALTIIKVQNMIGVVYFLPFFLIFESKYFLQVTPDMRLISALLQLAFFASSLAFVLYTIVTKHLGISRTNIFSNLIPVFTAITSYFLISETIGVNKITGIILVVTGVVLSQSGVFGGWRWLKINQSKNTSKT